MKLWQNFGKNLIVALSLALFLGFILPLQTYLGNSSLYTFTVGRMLLELGVLTLIIALAGFVLLQFIGRFLGEYLNSLWVAALVCLYLESGILSAGLPQINGGFAPELVVTSQGIIDIAVWSVVILGFLLTTKWTRDYLHYIALAVLAISIGSIFDVRKDTGISETATNGSSLTKGFEWQYDVITNAKFSKTRNVLIFVLDSMPANVSSEVVGASPELMAKFPGFVAYSDNIAMHDCTKYGLPGLMTGKYFEPGVSTIAEYPMSMYGDDSILKPYVEAGAAVAFSPDLLPYGYTNIPIEKRAERKGKQKHGWAALLLRSKEVPYLSLFDFTVFRFVPYFAKAPFLFAKIRHDPMIGRDDSNFWYEHVMYKLLAESKPLEDKALMLGVFHSRGAHPPLVFDKEGHRLKETKYGPEAMEELAYNPLYQLGKLMDNLRARGIYDKSLIIVAADHGVVIAPKNEGRNPRDSSILWIKPEGYKGAFSFSSLKTSNSKIAPVVRASLNGPISLGNIEQLLKTDKRLFREERADESGYDDTIIE